MALKDLPVKEVVVGLDLGSYRTGVAVLGVAKGAKLLHKARVVAASDRTVERWDTTIATLEKFFEEFVMGRPVVVAVEQPNAFRNGATTRMLTGLFGAVLLWLHRNDITAVEVNTSHAKKVFCGKSSAGKQPTIDRANELYGLSLKYHSRPEKSEDDVADAIQVAWALRHDLIETDEWFREMSEKEA